MTKLQARRLEQHYEHSWLVAWKLGFAMRRALRRATVRSQETHSRRIGAPGGALLVLVMVAGLRKRWVWLAGWLAGTEGGLEKGNRLEIG